MMQLCRFYSPDTGPRLGALAEGTVYDLSASGIPQLADVSALLQASLEAPLAEWLGQADTALERADLKTYRKRVETVIARLGHLK